MTARFAIVGCGAKKKPIGPDATVEARRLYTSTYFEKKRRYAEEACDEWRILSAKHGVFDPSRSIRRYEVPIEDIDSGRFADGVIGDLDEIDFGPVDEVVILVGRRYLDPLEGRLAAAIDARLRRPFDETSGIGEQMRVLDQLIDEEGRDCQTDLGRWGK